MAKAQIRRSPFGPSKPTKTGVLNLLGFETPTPSGLISISEDHQGHVSRLAYDSAMLCIWKTEEWEAIYNISRTSTHQANKSYRSPTLPA